MSFTKRLAVLSLILTVGSMLRVHVQDPPSAGIGGPWEGAIQVAAATLRMRVVFTETPSELRAAIDIPQQGAAGYRLRR